jgi:hypothetical protein
MPPGAVRLLAHGIYRVDAGDGAGSRVVAVDPRTGGVVCDCFRAPSPCEHGDLVVWWLAESPVWIRPDWDEPDWAEEPPEPT